jgi:DNA-binding NarL/FixJ family response regulator
VLNRRARQVTLDKVVLAGARAWWGRSGCELILTAIEVHEGQIWLRSCATSRVFVEFSREGAAHAANPERAKMESLTDRERMVVVATTCNAGATAKEIAAGLHISEHTLRNHLTSIYDKLDVANRLELFAYAQKYGLTKNPSSDR